MPEERACDPLAERLEGTCLVTAREIASFYLGLISIACWCVCQLPQLYKNYQKQSAKGVSFGLVIQWILGDTCNFIGTILTRQLPFQKAASLLFISLDMMMFYQKIRYDTQFFRTASLSIGSSVGLAALGASALAVESVEAQSILATAAMEEAEDASISSTRMMIGAMMGWIATAFYMGSRCAQIWHMLRQRRRTTPPTTSGAALEEPLVAERTGEEEDDDDDERVEPVKEERPSIVMFIFAVFGNAFYGSALVTRTLTRKAFLKALPWLVGSFGVMFLDGVILTLMLTS